MDGLMFEHQAKDRARILERLRAINAEQQRIEPYTPADAERFSREAFQLIIEYLELIGAQDMADAYEAVITEYVAV